MKYRVYTETRKSCNPRHKQNEDNFMFSEVSFMGDKKIRIMAVADGMGGLANGAKASRNAISGFMASFMEEVMKNYLLADMDEYSQSYAIDEIKRAMILAIQKANRKICDHADVFQATGSTISTVCVVDDYAVIANVGDSPVYYYKNRNRRFSLVSRLHNAAEQDVEAGLYPRYSREYFNRNHLLYSSLGEYSELNEDDIYVNAIGRLRKGDMILLGSDGCFGHLNDAMIRELLEDCPEEEESFILQQLFDMARREEDDDQTAVWYILGEGEE